MNLETDNPLPAGVCRIQLFHYRKPVPGKFALVSAEDFDHLNQWRWAAIKNKNGTEYIGRWKRRKSASSRLVLIHQEIMQAPKGLEIDHRNGKTWDNTRSNLRICTHAQNMRNRKMQRNNKCGFKGVTSRQLLSRMVYFATICADNKDYHLGTFATPEVAARAYDIRARELFGQFARLNFPDTT